VHFITWVKQVYLSVLEVVLNFLFLMIDLLLLVEFKFLLVIISFFDFHIAVLRMIVLSIEAQVTIFL